MHPTVFLLVLLAPATFAAIQCYVGQKLFSLESNMAVCAPFVPYHCAAACEWKPNCTSHVSYDLFDGRRTFVSGVLINQKSLMLLCCSSLSTQVQADRQGERCAWRSPDSIPVVGPSIRTDPVLGLNHYIREIKMARDGDSRVDIQLEVCQYEKVFENCKEEKMTDSEIAAMNKIKEKLDRAVAEAEIAATAPTTTSATTTPASTTTSITAEVTVNSFVSSTPSIIHKATDEEKHEESKDEICQRVINTECGKTIHSKIAACCKDLSACDRTCLRGVEKSLLTELIKQRRGCTTSEVRDTLDCLARKVSTLAQQ